MSKSATLILLGAVIALSPFFGLPGSWLSFILVVCGFAVGAVGYFMRSSPMSPHKEDAL